MAVAYSSLSALNRIRVACDFDGTITHQDTLKMLLNAFGGQKWPTYVEQICREEVSEREALPLIMSDLRIDLSQAIDFLLEQVDFDPHFAEFVNWCDEHDYPLVIFSGGFEELIRPLLKREGFEHLSVQANRVKVVDDQWNVIAHSGQRICDKQNHCKCASIRSSGPTSDIVVYVGDGHTDRCPVQIADLVFAKAFLRNYCEKNKISYYPFESFANIKAQLDLVLESAEETKSAAQVRG